MSEVGDAGKADTDESTAIIVGGAKTTELTSVSPVDFGSQKSNISTSFLNETRDLQISA